VPLPHTGPPHEPQTAQASGQQSPNPSHAASQKQPAGAADDPSQLQSAAQPQSMPQLAAVSPG
jgi:hypothetical protein